MTGISKINKINNAGIFAKFVWPSAPSDLAFKKINLLYGYNGSGKTTLSNIIGLFSEDYDDLTQKRISSGISSDGTKALEAEIEWDGKVAKFPTDKKKVYVFNSVFVSDHVYDGSQAKVKSFKRDVVTKEQLSNQALKRITDAITAENDKKSAAETYLKKLDTLFAAIKKELSKAWNDNIDGTRMPALDLEACPQNPPHESEENLQKALDEEFSKFKVSKDQAALERDIASLNQLNSDTASLPKDFNTVISKSISRLAREKVQKKIDDYKSHGLKHTTVQNWFDDGADLLKKTKGKAVCPLCESSLPNIDELISSYEAFFNDELAALMSEIRGIISSFDNSLSDAEKRQSQTLTLQEIASRYSYFDVITDNEKDALKRIGGQDVRKHLLTVKTIFENKRDDADFIPAAEQIQEFDNLITIFAQFKSDIAAMLLVKSRILEKLQNSRFDARGAKEVCTSLFWKKFDIQGKITAKEGRTEGKLDIPDKIGGVGFLSTVKNHLSMIAGTIAAKEAEKIVELAKLKKESEYVNIFLKRLCVSNFTIDTSDDGGIVVHYSGVPPKGIQYSLSEGEKTALAFAYFLSKYRYEVVENQRAKQEDYTVVIDDPVSSLDENRLFSTALLIQDALLPKAATTGSGENKVTNWSGCSQIFIFSHNLVFLKFLGNIIDSDQSSGRSDLYLEKGEISILPEILRNYQTSYFYKLDKIQAFVNKDIGYDSVKDLLPNYIRVTLEAFISFKFARLRDKGNRHKPAMLDYLIKHLTGSGYDFSSFPAVGGISDKETLKAALQEIKNKVNPECHGTTQDITHLEYLPETELRKLAEQTLHVIAFLDRLHIDAVQKTKSAVA